MAKPLGIYKAIHPTQITNEKVRTYVLLDHLWKMMDALGLCVFGFAPRGVMPLDLMVQCLNAVTGWNTNLFELMKAAERGTILARAFNSLEGFTIKVINRQNVYSIRNPMAQRPGADLHGKTISKSH